MRLLHTMLRVGNLERSLAFYTEVLGMQLLRRRDNPQCRYTVVFVGYGPESDTAVLELTHNWDTEQYEIGGAYGHIGIGCDDIALTCAAIRERGGRVVREPAPVKGGTSVIAFVEDPDGYRIELIERPPGAEAASVVASAAVAATSPAVPAVGACEPAAAAAAAVPSPR